MGRTQWKAGQIVPPIRDSHGIFSSKPAQPCISFCYKPVAGWEASAAEFPNIWNLSRFLGFETAVLRFKVKVASAFSHWLTACILLQRLGIIMLQRVVDSMVLGVFGLLFQVAVALLRQFRRT